jgi:hypothetical protein
MDSSAVLFGWIEMGNYFIAAQVLPWGGQNLQPEIGGGRKMRNKMHLDRVEKLFVKQPEAATGCTTRLVV